MTECTHPNHCIQLRLAGENLVRQEIKIKQLEQEKAELIEFIEFLSNAKYFDDFKKINKDLKVLLDKYSK